MNYISGTIKFVTRHRNSQIYAYNCKGPAKSNLLSLYRSFFLYTIMRFLFRSGIENDVFAEDA